MTAHEQVTATLTSDQHGLPEGMYDGTGDHPEFEQDCLDERYPEEEDVEPWVPADMLNLYIDAIRNLPLLTKEEEYRVAMLVRQGNADARATLIQCNLRLVISIARRYLNKGMGFMDLIEEGNVGLIRAVERFEPELGYRLSTYAFWWIRSSIETALRRQTQAIKLPLRILNGLHRIRAVRSKLEAQRGDGARASSQEIAEVVGMTPAEVDEILQVGSTMVAVNQTSSDEEWSAASIFAKEDAQSRPDERLEQLQLGSLIMRYVHDLPTPEQFVLTSKFGLENAEPQPTVMIAKRLGVSTARVRQLQERALRKLRHRCIDERATPPPQRCSY